MPLEILATVPESWTWNSEPAENSNKVDCYMIVSQLVSYLTSLENTVSCKSFFDRLIVTTLEENIPRGPCNSRTVFDFETQGLRDYLADTSLT